MKETLHTEEFYWVINLMPESMVLLRILLMIYKPFQKDADVKGEQA